MTNVAELNKIKFKNNFLKNVIFRIDFSPILSIKEELSAEFQEALRIEFPTIEHQKATEYNVAIKENKRIEEIKDFLIWSLFDKDKNKKITICYKYIILEFFRYSDFISFQSTANNFYSLFAKHYGLLDCKRLGLRYINNITFKEGNPLKWSDYINQNLITPIEDFIGNKDEIARAMSQITLNKSDFKLVFTFGIFNPEFPNPISRKEFILDYDCFTNDIEKNNVIDTLEKFNLEILALFLESITKNLKGLMNQNGE